MCFNSVQPSVMMLSEPCPNYILEYLSFGVFLCVFKVSKEYSGNKSVQSKQCFFSGLSKAGHTFFMKVAPGLCIAARNFLKKTRPS